MELILRARKARAPLVLTDHLLDEFLILLDDPADLIRASAVCKTSRRLITDPTFLRWYRSLHSPQLFGFVFPGYYKSFVPVEAPHPNAPAARAFADEADFTFPQLPDRGRDGWWYCDAGDGRVLMACSDPSRGLVLPELAVCEPLTQGYILLPAIPHNLLAAVSVQIQNENIEFFDAFFDPSGGNEDEEHFRVMCWTRNPTKGAIFIYSSVSNTWTHGASIAWHTIGLNFPEGIVLLDVWPSYAYGCLYWQDVNKLIRLNISNMEFSIVDLPADYENRKVVFVEAGEGRIGMFSLIIISDPENPEPLRYSIRQNESENANGHPVETTIPLPNEYLYDMDCVAEGYIFLIGRSRDLTLGTAFFSLEIKTRKVEKLCLSFCVPNRLIPYFGFPPFMSPRRM